jgi:hypothetical protein
MNERAIEKAQKPARQHAPAFLSCDAGAWVVHEGEARDSVPCSRVPELNSRQVLDRLVSIVSRRDQSQWCTVIDWDGFTVKTICQEHVWSEEIFKQHSRACAILAAKRH